MSASNAPALVWFRDDLRLADHPALAAAVATRRPVVCLYVLDEVSAGRRPLGGAARWWLEGSLAALDADLQRRGSRLILRRGAGADLVPALAAEIGAGVVLWNRRYDHGGIAVDDAVAHRLAADGVAVKDFHANLLFEPEQVKSQAGTPLSVFSAFWRAARRLGAPRAPLPAPKTIPAGPACASDDRAAWGLAPRAPDWAGGLRETWTPGEAAARERAILFVDEILAGYAQMRDRPDRDGTSRLSPHLRFGEISPFALWQAAQTAREHAQGRRAATDDIEKFLAELGWREFNHHLLHRRPALASANVQPRFDNFSWREAPAELAAWQRGATGYPVVDAGMRQLWTTGFMHNRVRMVAASFLTKHLMIDWRAGEAWFWDTLVDADAASNPANWQWVAGTGADAAPYVRVFNPVLQGEKFDPNGAYVRRFVPELAGLPTDAIHAPWTATPIVLASAGVVLGKTYPAPMVDHAAARARALAGYERLRGAGGGEVRKS